MIQGVAFQQHFSTRKLANLSLEFSPWICYNRTMSKQNNWIIRTSDMDGVPTHEVVHRLDLESIQKGMYAPGVVQGMSWDRAEMQQLADRLNRENRPAPKNPFRGVMV